MVIKQNVSLVEISTKFKSNGKKHYFLRLILVLTFKLQHGQKESNVSAGKHKIFMI